MSDIGFLAKRIAAAIFYDLSGRSGVLDSIDRETLDEILATMEQLCLRQLHWFYSTQEKAPKRWKYFSTNLYGNAHDAVRQINAHPEWDVICMSFDGENGTPGSVTLVVHREEITE